GADRGGLSRYRQPGEPGVARLARSGLRSTCIISAGLEVIGAFGWFEYGRAGIEGGEQAGHGSFGYLSQEGLELGVGLLDRVHVGAVGWQVSQLGPDRVDEFLDLGSLVAR